MSKIGLCPFWEQSWDIDEQHQYDVRNHRRCMGCSGEFSEGCPAKDKPFREWYELVYGVSISE